MGKSATQTWLVLGLLLLFVLPVMGYASYSVADRWYQGYQLSREEAELRNDITRLREANIRLQGELKDARSDAYIEGVAREQLGLVRPGDRAIVLVGPPPAAPAPPAPEPAVRRTEPSAAPPPPAEPGGWRKLFDAIFGH